MRLSGLDEEAELSLEKLLARCMGDIGCIYLSMSMIGVGRRKRAC